MSEIGKIVEFEWLKTFELRKDMNLNMGEFAVMPNHFHAIIGIGENPYNTQRRTQSGTDGGRVSNGKKIHFSAPNKIKYNDPKRTEEEMGSGIHKLKIESNTGIRLRFFSKVPTEYLRMFIEVG